MFFYYLKKKKYLCKLFLVCYSIRETAITL